MWLLILFLTGALGVVEGSLVNRHDPLMPLILRVSWICLLNLVVALLAGAILYLAGVLASQWPIVLLSVILNTGVFTITTLMVIPV